jgi:signal transduction histidine kinase
VDLDKLMREVIAQNEQLQTPQAEIEWQPPLLKVMAHEPSLAQCVANLLSNAVKFVLPATTPRVKIWTEPMPGERGAAGASPDAGEPMVRIWFEDNGIGIDSANQGRIFGIFERVHSVEQYEGTGIGLAIVRKNIERMGGSVGVQSEPGIGSRFWIQLKAAAGE